MIFLTVRAADKLTTCAKRTETQHPGLRPRRELRAGSQLVSRRLGDDWLREGRTAVLLVPSVVFDVERNALMNPAHADYRAIRVVDVASVRWDDRLFPRTS